MGDDSGQVLALDTEGRELWRGATTIVDYIRGLDDARVGGQAARRMANHNGLVKLFDETGHALWEYDLGSDLRRLRAYDLDGDGSGEILIGGDGSRLVLLEAATGVERFAKGVGQTIVEIREAELNGDPVRGSSWSAGAMAACGPSPPRAPSSRHPPLRPGDRDRGD